MSSLLVVLEIYEFESFTNLHKFDVTRKNSSSRGITILSEIYNILQLIQVALKKKTADLRVT